MITAQQARVRARFPDTPVGELKLLPIPRRNPDGSKAISLDAARGPGRSRVAQMNRQVLTNLNRMIDGIQTDHAPTDLDGKADAI